MNRLRKVGRPYRHGDTRSELIVIKSSAGTCPQEKHGVGPVREGRSSFRGVITGQSPSPLDPVVIVIKMFVVAIVLRGG